MSNANYGPGYDDGFFYPGEDPKPGEMRISFMGTSVFQRRTQVCSSVFVELGNSDEQGNLKIDSFVFDCGSGCTVNYTTMQVPMSRMRKVFLTHLHGDHTSDLTHLYGFGPQGDGKSPLYIYGPSASLVPDPNTGDIYDDGTLNFCHHLREMNRWHTEAQSFVGTQWRAEDGDGYEIRAIELNWRTGGKRTWSSTEPYPGKDENPCGPGAKNYPVEAGIAYNENGVKISFFPAVHDRNGSISYKLEWNGLSMIYTGDTQPNQFLIDQASSGVDVLISEMVVPPEVWAEKNSPENTEPNPQLLKTFAAIQKNSHTPQRALGYILSKLKGMGCPPKLAVATHFQAENQFDGDDTISPALKDIRGDYDGSTYSYDGSVVIATDLMVISVSKDSPPKCRPAKVSDYAWAPPVKYANAGQGIFVPKYNDLHDPDHSKNNPYSPMAPWAQFDQWLLDNVIHASEYDPPSDDGYYPPGLDVCKQSS